MAAKEQPKPTPAKEIADKFQPVFDSISEEEQERLLDFAAILRGECRVNEGMTLLRKKLYTDGLPPPTKKKDMASAVSNKSV